MIHFKIMDRCVAAVVTDTHDDSIDLHTFPPRDLAIGDQLNIREGDANGSWHWPERA